VRLQHRTQHDQLAQQTGVIEAGATADGPAAVAPPGTNSE
jgi:hypothetical protein